MQICKFCKTPFRVKPEQSSSTLCSDCKNLIQIGRTHNWVIFDLDGTLVSRTDRLHHIQVKDYASFHQAECTTSKPLQGTLLFLKQLKQDGYKIAVVSGRPDSYQSQTWDWLIKYNLFEDVDRLIMRPVKKMSQPDEVLKKDILHLFFGCTLFDKRLHLVVDDRDKVVNMWRSQGLTTVQVGKGDF